MDDSRYRLFEWMQAGALGDSCIAAVNGGALFAGILIAVAGVWTMPAVGEQPCANPRYAHGISHLLPLRYGS